MKAAEAEKIDAYFGKCLAASNFDSLDKMKQLLTVLLSGKLRSDFDESSNVSHLFDETRKRATLSTEDSEELFSIELTYSLERGHLEQVRQVPPKHHRLTSFLEAVITKRHSN